MAEAATQEDVNPNIEVGIEEDTAAAAGRGMTFDDIDSITDDEPAPKAKESKSEKPKEAKQKTKDVESGKDTGTTEGEESTEAPAKGDNGQLPTGEAQEASQSLKGNKIKATYNDQDFDMHTGAYLPVKVDGEVKQIQVQELMNNYAGAQSWDKRFSDLSTDKNKFQDRVDVLEDYVSDIFNKANSINDSEDPVKSSFEVLRLIGNLTGQDSRTLMKNIRGAFRQEATQYQDLDEIQRENWELRQDAEYSNLEAELNTQSRQKAEDKESAQRHQIQTLETFNISPERFRELGSDLAKNPGFEGKPDLNTVIHFDRILMANSAITAFDASLINNQDLRNQLVDYSIKDPSITEADLISILTDSFGDSEEAARERKAAENLKRKLGNANQPKAQKPIVKDDRKFQNSAELWDDVD